MVAVVKIFQWNGTSGAQASTDQTGGNIRFKTADASSGVTTNNPISIPNAGSSWSFQVYQQLNITVAPAVQISNLTNYSGGSNPWTGVNLWAQNVAAYGTPVLESSSAGYTNWFTYTSGAPLSLSVHAGGPYTTTGAIGDFLKMAMEVTSSASNGILATTTNSYSYLEI